VGGPQKVGGQHPAINEWRKFRKGKKKPVRSQVRKKEQRGRKKKKDHTGWPQKKKEIL